MLEVKSLSVQYGKHRARRRCGAERRPRARSSSSWAPTAPASPRCSRPSPACSRPAPARAWRSTAASWSGCRRTEIVEAGLALVPEGRGIFGELTVRENLLLGAFARRARADEARQSRARAGAVPAARRAARPDRAHHERRRAADGGDRPGPDVGARDAAARRALARPVAPAERRAVPRAGPHPRATASACCWSSRMRARAWPSPTAAI